MLKMIRYDALLRIYALVGCDAFQHGSTIAFISISAPIFRVGLIAKVALGNARVKILNVRVDILI